MSITLCTAPTNNHRAPEHTAESKKLNPASVVANSVQGKSLCRLDVLPVEEGVRDRSQPPRRLRPLRFAFGMLLTGSGMAMILLIGIRVIEVRLIGGDFAMPLVAFGVVSGVMLLGGGFGIMATSASGFDEDEFDRLADAGNISAAPTLPELDTSADEADESIFVTQTRRPA